MNGKIQKSMKKHWTWSIIFDNIPCEISEDFR